METCFIHFLSSIHNVFILLSIHLYFYSMGRLSMPFIKFKLFEVIIFSSFCIFHFFFFHFAFGCVPCYELNILRYQSMISKLFNSLHAFFDIIVVRTKKIAFA